MVMLNAAHDEAPVDRAPDPAPVPAPAAGPDLDDPKLYINRELSLLEFFRRVLEEAKDPTNPLLERVKFLAIVASNMDEFFMVRVAALVRKERAGGQQTSIDGMGTSTLLA